MTNQTQALPSPRPLNVLMGIPDDRLCMIRSKDQGKRLGVDLPGTASILPFVRRRVFDFNIIYLEPGPASGQIVLGPGPIVNHIADPDRCSGALNKVVLIAERSGRACFNHPRSVLRTTRDGVARALAGVPDLQVPATIRLNTAEPDESSSRHRGKRAALSGAPASCRRSWRRQHDQDRHAGRNRQRSNP